MKVEIYIGTEKLDFNDKLNVQYSIRELLDNFTIKNNSSFAINLPVTENNIKLLEYIYYINSQEEVSSLTFIKVDDSQILIGYLKVLEISDKIKIVITSNEWFNNIAQNDLKDLDFSSYDHNMTESVMNSSDSAFHYFYRYPLINWGIKQKPGAAVAVGDRLPMFQIWDIYEKILYPYNIFTNLSSILEDLYITCDIPYNDEDFIEQGTFRAEFSTNQVYSDTVPWAPASYPVEVFSGSTYRTMEYDDEISDEGGNYNDSSYYFTVPADGMYKFKASFRCGVTQEPAIQATVNPVITGEIIVDDGSPTTIETTVDTSISGYGQTTVVMESDYEYLESGDIVYVKITLTDTVDNVDIIDHDYVFTIYSDSDDTYFYSIPSVYFGKNYPVVISDFMPAINQLDFLKAVNHLYSIVMFVDESKKNIYAYSYNDFYSTNVRDWSDKIDHKKDIVQKFISTNLSKYYSLRFKDSPSDILLSEYNESQENPLGCKDITLNSEYSINKKTILENPVFSTVIMAQFGQVQKSSDNELTTNTYLVVNQDVPVIWENREHECVGGITRPASRIRNFNVKIMKWEGLQTGSWTFETTGKSTFPQMSALSYSTLYDTYHWHEFQRIDKGKIIIAECVLKSSDLNYFITVVDTADEEGFRTKYKFKYKDEYFYGYIHEIIYNGERAKVKIIKAP